MVKQIEEGYEINDWGNKVPKSKLGNMVGGFVSILIGMDLLK